MTTKTTGAEWKRYYSDLSAWPDGAYHDDQLIVVDGVDSCEFDIDLSTVADSAQITIECGMYFSSEKDAEGRSLEAHFRRWRKSQSITLLTVEAPNDRLDAIKAAIKSTGGKVRT